MPETPSPSLWLHSTDPGQPLRCEVRPDLGGCIAGLWWGDLPVLRHTPAELLHSARQAGSYPLVPFSNRMAQAMLQWQGTGHPLVRNNAPEPHAIHGVGWQRPWAVLEHEAGLLMLGYEHRPDASWPFAFDASQTLRLRGGTLELVLGMTNQSGQPVPAGLGWHPWFVKRPGAHIAFEATARWEMGEDKLPTHRTPSTGLHADAARVDLDHCFEDWSGQTVLRDPQLTTRIRANTHFLVVCTQPGRAEVAIEPVSHVNNALQLLQGSGRSAAELGVVTLAPGESLTVQMAIEVQTTGAPA